MNKAWKAVLNILFIIIPLFTLTAANLRFHDKSDISERERRTLASFPELNRQTLFSGEFSAGVHDYISDRFVFREKMTLAGFAIKSNLGLPGRESVELITVARGDRFADVSDEQEVSAAANRDTETESSPSVEKNGSTAEGKTSTENGSREEAPPKEEKVNQVLVVGDQAAEVTDYKQDFGRYYAHSVHGFLSRLKNPVHAYVVLVPTRIAFMDEYAQLGSDQLTGINYFYSLLGDQVTTVDAYTALEPHKDEYIYFRTDHHWTARGAYHVYRKFIQAAGFTPIPDWWYEKKYVPGFTGSMYAYTLNDKMAENPDTIEVFVPYVEYDFWVYWNDVGRKKEVIDYDYLSDANMYQIFISSDQQISIIKNNIDSEKKILVFKDSYANAFIPFLMPHYREIHIIDPRYYTHNAVQYCDVNGIDDVLFFNYFGVVAPAGGYAWYLEKVSTLPYDQAPWEPVRLSQGENGEKQEVYRE